MLVKVFPGNASRRVIIRSGNGLSLVWHQAHAWGNGDTLTIKPSATKISWILMKIRNIFFNEIYLIMPSPKCRPYSSAKWQQADYTKVLTRHPINTESQSISIKTIKPSLLGQTGPAMVPRHCSWKVTWDSVLRTRQHCFVSREIFWNSYNDGNPEQTIRNTLKPVQNGRLFRRHFLELIIAFGFKFNWSLSPKVQLTYRWLCARARLQYPNCKRIGDSRTKPLI